ncbi:hypothetical protein EJ03DRAFT_215634 [Teratosphaeria nubilosa]|uniref:Uncharacterized protein n=1 Tax=Teratosphaeria nubilosa TaxID=161662 RepID=A0A6G1LH67_9PEZI|nr:hypothetical protein EJ03DRAFT_215634 [Teratosphaeria nubilosa]
MVDWESGWGITDYAKRQSGFDRAEKIRDLQLAGGSYSRSNVDVSFDTSLETPSPNILRALPNNLLHRSTTFASQPAASIFAIMCTMLWGWYSRRCQCRATSVMLGYTVGMIGIIVMWPSLYYSELVGLAYFVLFLVIAGFNM